MHKAVRARYGLPNLDIRAPHMGSDLQVNNLPIARQSRFQLPRGIMAATQKLYPRGTVKRIVKAHSNRSVSKNADILVSPSVQCACQQARSRC